MNAYDYPQDWREPFETRRKALGLSRGELAAAMGCRPALVSRALHVNANLTIESLQRLARGLECELRIVLVPIPASLVPHPEAPPPPPQVLP